MKAQATWLSSERARVPGVAVLQRGVWQQGLIGGILGPLGGELARLVAVLAVRPGCHLGG